MRFWLKNLFEQLFLRRSHSNTAAPIAPSAEKDLVEIAKFFLRSDLDVVFWTDDAGNFIDFNDATCELLGYSRSELKSMKVADIDPEITPENHKLLLERLEKNQSVVVQTHPRRKDGTFTTFEFKVQRLVIDGRVYLCTSGHEIELEKSYRNLVLDAIATGQPLTETLNLIVRLAEETRMGMIGSILLLDESNVLRHGASIQLSDSYCQQIDGLVPGPSVGSCGTAVFKGESVLVADIVESPLWEGFQSLAEEEGLRACWSEPICSSRKQVVGTLAMYFQDVCYPTDVDRELMKSFARIAAIAIERSLETQSLIRSELRFRSLVQYTSSTVWTTDPAGAFICRQESWEAYTGQGWEEHQGFGWKEAIHPEDQERIVSCWLAAIETGSTFQSYGRVWNAATGAYRHFEVQAVSVMVDGRIVEWSGCTVDVHDRKSTEKTMEQNERQLRIITNALPICIGHIDCDYRYRFNNLMYETFFGKSAVDIRGRTVSEVIGVAGFRLAKPKIDAALQGKQVTYEQRHVGLDDVSRIGETRLVPNRNEEGAVIGVFVLTDDITQRRALEKEVLKVAANQQRRMGQDLHDGIGQELTGLGMIADTLHQALRQSNRQEMSIALKLSEGIRRTLKQAKLLARGLNPVDISPGGICSALTEMARHVEDLYGITCQANCNCNAAVDPEVATNLFRIAQEATTNAAKHSQAKTIMISLQSVESRIELSVIDNGCGFDLGSKRSRGMGLRTMEYRAGVIGARIQIASNEVAGVGTRVFCQAPVSARAVFANETEPAGSVANSEIR